jgi:hypothetical protein
MQAMFRQIQRDPTTNDYKDSAELRSQSPKNGLIHVNPQGEQHRGGLAQSPSSFFMRSTTSRG